MILCLLSSMFSKQKNGLSEFKFWTWLADFFILLLLQRTSNNNSQFFLFMTDGSIEWSISILSLKLTLSDNDESEKCLKLAVLAPTTFFFSLWDLLFYSLTRSSTKKEWKRRRRRRNFCNRRGENWPLKKFMIIFQKKSVVQIS